MTEERVAAAMWREETVDAGTPESVTDRRTYEEFLGAGPITRSKWLKFARAAISAIQPTAPDPWHGVFDNKEMLATTALIDQPSPDAPPVAEAAMVNAADVMAKLIDDHCIPNAEMDKDELLIELLTSALDEYRAISKTPAPLKG